MSRSKSVPPNEPKRLGTDELGFFVQMVKFHLQVAPPAVQERFWATIRKQCPQLLTAISASFTGEWGEITFTRSISNAAFAPDDPDEEGHTVSH